MNLIVDADALIEADEIGAAAEEHVLAIVDDFIDAGMQIGTCATAEVAPPLNKIDAQPGFSQRAGGTHAGYAPADDGDRSVGISAQTSLPFLLN